MEIWRAIWKSGGGFKCLAWAFMTNHLHQLLLPTEAKLAEVMRRLLAAYAVTFNLRHHPNGISFNTG